MSECPYCAELKRRGILEAIEVIERQMLEHNFYIQYVVNLVGTERAADLNRDCEAFVEAEMAAKRQ